MWEVIETAEHVAKKSHQVRINKQALGHFSRRLLADEIEVPPWDSPYHFCGHDEDTVSYLLVLDSLNFCFWPVSEKVKWEIEYESRRLSGYYALAASLKQAIESGIPITRGDYLAELSIGKLRKVLGGQGRLQLLEDRVQILNEVGQLLLREHDGKAHQLVEASGMSAVALARLLAQKLSSFSPAVMGLGKSSFYRIADMAMDDALDYLRSQLTINTQCEDLMEGIAAFMEKREPKWKGR